MWERPGSLWLGEAYGTSEAPGPLAFLLVEGEAVLQADPTAEQSPLPSRWFPVPSRVVAWGPGQGYRSLSLLVFSRGWVCVSSGPGQQG